MVDLDAEEAVGAEPADYIEWTYTRHDGGDAETFVQQRQRPRGRVHVHVGDPQSASPTRTNQRSDVCRDQTTSVCVTCPKAHSLDG